MSQLTKIVENKVADLLPSSFALDGSSCTSTKFLVVFGSFHSDLSRGFETQLLTFSPLEDKASLIDEEHYQFMPCVPGLNGKAW